MATTALTLDTFEQTVTQPGIVLVDFWASWCGPCRREMPTIARLHQDYKDKGVVVVGVNVCDLEPEAEDFVEEFGITYSIVRDPDQELSEALGVECRLPQTMFVDADGQLVATTYGREEVVGGPGRVVLGGLTPEQLESRIEQLLTTGSET